jgi:hypothetical protein
MLNVLFASSSAGSSFTSALSVPSIKPRHRVHSEIAHRVRRDRFTGSTDQFARSSEATIDNYIAETAVPATLERQTTILIKTVCRWADRLTC